MRTGRSSPLSTSETVALDTPAARATSAIVTAVERFSKPALAGYASAPAVSRLVFPQRGPPRSFPRRGPIRVENKWSLEEFYLPLDRSAAVGRHSRRRRE